MLTTSRQMPFLRNLIAAACLVLLLGGSAFAQNVLKAGIIPIVPPLMSLNNEAQPVGFAVDTFHNVAIQAGYIPSIQVYGSLADALQAVREGEIDVVVGLGITPARLSEFAFTTPFATMPVVCFVRMETKGIGGVDDLVGRPTAVLDQSSAMTALVPHLGVPMVPHHNVETMLFELLSGNVDALYYPEQALWRIARQVGVEDRIKEVGEPLLEIKRAFLLRKDRVELRERLNEAIRAYVGSEEFQSNFREWYGKPKPLYTSRDVLYVSAVILTLIVVGMAVWRYNAVLRFNRKLQDSVRARQKAEESLNEAQAMANLGSFERNLATGVTYCSEQLCTMFCLDAGTDMPLEAFARCLHPDDQKRLLDLLHANPDKASCFSFEVRYRPLDSHDYRHAQCHVEHAEDEGGRVVKVRGTVLDITERKAIEEELLLARDRAQAANVAKSEFLANMSHELRTPLNGAMGMLQLLRQEQLNSEQLEYVNTALDSCRNLTRLIGDILDLSKIEAGKLELMSEPFSPREEMALILNTFQLQARSKDVDLRCLVDDEVPEVLLGDGMRVRQLLINLVGNAIKFTPSGTVDAVITALPSPGEGLARVLITVRDTGIGIDPQIQAMIFNAFTQAEGSFSRTHQGTGLGLQIVKRLAGLMHGSLSLDSEPGQGSTFYVSLPFLLPGGQAMPITAVTESRPKAEGKNILVVEDDPTSQQVLKGLLTNLGFDVTCVDNGRQALDVWRKGMFAATFMDIQMPEMNGVEATRAIRHLPQGSEAVIIALTAHAMDGDRQSFLEQGMNDYLAKPVDADELAGVLARNLGT